MLADYALMCDRGINNNCSLQREYFAYSEREYYAYSEREYSAYSEREYYAYSERE
jgi:hypothetical protein